MEAIAAPQSWGAFNVWDLYDLEYSREIPIRSLDTFLHFLYSEGADKVNADGIATTGLRAATFHVFGPITDDAMEDGVKLTETEVRGVKRPGTPPYEIRRLRAKFRVLREGLMNRLRTEEEKDAFVARLVYLELSPSILTQVCKALELNRGKRVI